MAFVDENFDSLEDALDHYQEQLENMSTEEFIEMAREAGFEVEENDNHDDNCDGGINRHDIKRL
jgi:hypothetical protein